MKAFVVLFFILIMVNEKSHSQNNQLILFPFTFEQQSPTPDSIQICFVKVIPDSAKNLINNEIYAEPSLEWLLDYQ